MRNFETGGLFVKAMSQLLVRLEGKIFETFTRNERLSNSLRVLDACLVVISADFGPKCAL